MILQNYFRALLNKSFFVFSISLFCLANTSGQSSQKLMVKGKVQDFQSSSPLGFASISIFNSHDKKLVNGNLASDSGDFSIELAPGSYYGEIEFMGYSSHKMGEFVLSKEKPV
ncbi:MAG: carboxypeptidase-like regulatory domain-containing protein, partial [Chitinophagaceae bacterium]